MKTFIMNNGIAIPAIGIGTNTFGKEGNVFAGAINYDTTELDSAIDAGYRLIDTAIMYRNERVIGNAVRNSVINRDEFIITSKIPNKPEYIENDEAVHTAVRNSLKELQVDYIDIYLIHHPWDDNAAILRVWNILEQYVENGKIRTIGVSNFGEEQLQFLLDKARIKPALNQIECHPGKFQHELVDFCLKQGVLPEAWGPMSRLDEKSKISLQTIADQYQKSWAQVVLRYLYERNIVAIPKSHNADRQKHNLDIFDFELSPVDFEAIGAM